MFAPTPLRDLRISRKFPAREIRVAHGEEDLVLRPTMTTDAETIQRAIESSLPELKRFMPWAHLPQSAERQVERLKGVETDWLSGEDITMALFRDGPEGSEEMVVMVGLHPRVPLNPTALEVGYWAASPHHGKGCTTLAVRVMTLYAFDKLEAERVQVMCDAANVASRRVIEKCGFAFEGDALAVTKKPAPELVDAGLVWSGKNPIYALVPELFEAQAWVAELRPRVRYRNFAGYPVLSG